jgi:hypothetical protein
MGFRLSNFNRLGSAISVTIPTDEEGFMGRECPQKGCESYFKVKPGTGLKGTDIPCHCPYCGHMDSPQTFWTKEQIEYAKSVAIRRAAEAITKDLKQMEFDHKPRGTFGIGISLEVKSGAPLPLRYYREKQLETQVTCSICTLEYAVYGLFGYCPDCGTHNSLQILENNLSLTRKQLQLADGLIDSDLTRHLVEDALENCVSAFDGFAREACRLRAHKSTDAAKCEQISFQNLQRVKERLAMLFGIDLATSVDKSEWSFAHSGFMQRHLLAHKSGVIDQRYLDETGGPSSMLGRRLSIVPGDVDRLSAIVLKFGQYLIATLPSLR